MIDAPSLPVSNRFDVLYIDHVQNDNNISNPIRTEASVENPPPSRLPVHSTLGTLSIRQRKSLPHVYQLAATAGTQKLEILVELQSPDNGTVVSRKALLDTGASGMFLDKEFVKEQHFPTVKLPKPIQVLNIDGSPNLAGAITHVVDLVVRYRSHSERTLFAVTSLGKSSIVLGMPWFKTHNPVIDYVTGEVQLTQCSSSCRTCAPVWPAGRNAKWAFNHIRTSLLPNLDDTDSNDQN